MKEDWKGSMGGPPGSMTAWLYDLRLPSNEHRILDLMVKSADKEDGGLWPSEDHLAHWSGMTVRNVSRMIRKLEKKKLIKVWPMANRSSVYQVQCPYLSKKDNLERVELLRGTQLGDPRQVPKGVPDKLSGTSEETGCPVAADKSGPDGAVSPDRSGPLRDPNCPVEVVQGTTSINNEEDQGSTPLSEPQAASDASAAAPEQGQPGSIQFYADTWNEMAPKYRLATVQSLSNSRVRRLKARLADTNFNWDAILAKIPDAVGVHGQGWFGFDFVIGNDTNHLKLMEGKYDQSFGAGVGQGGGQAAQPSKQEDAISRARRAQNG